MLLGQGMRVLHMLVRTVMVMVMVKVDGVLGRAMHPTRRGRTTTRHHRLRPHRHHGRGSARHGWVRQLDRPRWRPRRGKPRLGHRQGWRSHRRPHSPRLARGHATCLPLRHPLLLGAPPRPRHRYRYRHRY